MPAPPFSFCLSWMYASSKTRCNEGNSLFRELLYGLLISLSGGIASGILSALFLGLLERVVSIFQGNPILVLGLPIAGWIGFVSYRSFGKGAEAGTSLILQAFHQRIEQVPFRMAPMVLLGTLLTHLFGGSVGREGTAVQMSVGALFGGSRWLGLGPEWNRHLVACGIAGGFGAVFGTPFAGAIFAVEMPAIGALQWRFLPFCFISSTIGHWVCLICGVTHSNFPQIASLDAERWQFWFLVVFSGCVFGCCARLFLLLQSGIRRAMELVGLSGLNKVLVLSVLVSLLGSMKGMHGYLGLGVESPIPSTPSLLGSFSSDGVSGWSWFWKLVFTSLTLSAGFRGGEVTPLFFIGAAIGNAFASIVDWPIDYFAALGMAAVFFGASHSPIAGCIMGIELFGVELAVPLFLCCHVSHWVCGGTGLYPDQRLGAKTVLPPPPT